MKQDSRFVGKIRVIGRGDTTDKDRALLALAEEKEGVVSQVPRKVAVTSLGTAASGNRGHAGIPGHRGGSMGNGNVPMPGGIKNTVRQNQIQKIVSGTRGKENLTPTEAEEVISRYNGEVEKYVANASVRVRVDYDVLEQIMEDGRFKSQFETHTSNGWFDKENKTRKGIEKGRFGLSEDTPVEDRPIYGYICDPDNATEEDYDKDNLMQYGRVVIELKDDVKNRASFMCGDSLSEAVTLTEYEGKIFSNDPDTYPPECQNCTPVPLQDADGSRFSAAVPSRVMESHPDAPFTPTRFSYVEAQVHGGLKTSDIKRILFLDKMDENDFRLNGLGKKYGISFEYVDPAVQADYEYDREMLKARGASA